MPVLFSAALAACAVIGSAPIVDERMAFVGCRSTLGSYSLPKGVLHIKILNTPPAKAHFLSLEPELVPDNRHIFCLDHLSSAFAADDVKVFKNKIKIANEQPQELPEATPYLQLVSSSAVDHTAGIIRRFIRAAFILLSNRQDFSPARSSLEVLENQAVVVADFKVDPFDYQEMARVNQAVREFGFCFVLEDYTFDRSHRGISPDHYCGAPYKMAVQKPPTTAQAVQKLHYLAAKPVSGIFFRPRASYRLSVYVNANPNRRGQWALAKTQNFEFENIMPIVSVGVDRAVFATRRTGLVFDDGMLMNVCIAKGSEVEGAIQIPLEVVYGLIALPSEMIRGAIDDASTAKQLLDARRNLIAAQNNYIKFLKREAAPPTGIGANQKLTLGGPPALPTFTNDLPTDPGAIVDRNKADALTSICKELLSRETARANGA